MPTPLTIGTARALLTPRNAITYLLGPFRFATDQAAPLASPHTEAGGVGSLTIVDSGTNWSTSGGQLHLAGGNGNTAQNKILATGVARAAGVAILVDLPTPATTGVQLIPLQLSTVATAIAFNAGTNHLAWRSDSGYISTLYVGSVSVAAHSGLAADMLMFVLRGTGTFALARAAAVWQLLWVEPSNAAATLYPQIGNHSSDGYFDNLRATALGGAWATDYGIATSYKATTTDADTATMTADALVYHTITAQTGVTQELRFRVTDASNYWLLRMAAPGTNTIKVIEVVAGVETERASTAQTFTNATQYRIGVIAAGAAITPYVDTTAKTGYASAATGLSATGVYVSHVGSKLECWPRNPSVPSGV